MKEHRSGRHFLQIPGPTNVPDRILRAMDRAVIDHRGPEFGELGAQLLSDVRSLFRTQHDVIIFPASRDRRLGSGTRQHVVARR